MCCISIIVLSLLLTLSPISPYAFAAPSLTGAPISYEVTCMDTLPEIATHYGVDWTQLARLNSIRGLLQEGMVLEIPSPRTNTLYNQCDAVKHVEMQTSGNLMGHAPNCELKFFEINMNTGNFHLRCISNPAHLQFQDVCFQVTFWPWLVFSIWRNFNPVSGWRHCLSHC